MIAIYIQFKPLKWEFRRLLSHKWAKDGKKRAEKALPATIAPEGRNTTDCGKAPENAPIGRILDGAK